jgi:hypothetical protein
MVQMHGLYAVATLSLDSFLASPAIGCATRTRRFQLTIAASFGGCDGAAASFWQHVGPEALLFAIYPVCMTLRAVGVSNSQSGVKIPAESRQSG